MNTQWPQTVFPNFKEGIQQNEIKICLSMLDEGGERLLNQDSSVSQK